MVGWSGSRHHFGWSFVVEEDMEGHALLSSSTETDVHVVAAHDSRRRCYHNAPHFRFRHCVCVGHQRKSARLSVANADGE